MNQISCVPAANFVVIPTALGIKSNSLLMRHGIFWTTSLSPASADTALPFLCEFQSSWPSFWPSDAPVSFLPQGLCTYCSLLQKHLSLAFASFVFQLQSHLLRDAFPNPTRSNLKAVPPNSLSWHQMYLFPSTPSHFYICFVTL